MKIKVEENASIGNVLKSGIELSAKAIGAYAVLLEADEEEIYPPMTEYLQLIFIDKITSITRALNELKEKGFLIKNVGRTPQGVFDVVTYVVTLPCNANSARKILVEEIGNG